MAGDFSFNSKVRFDKKGLNNPARQGGRSLQATIFLVLVTTLVTLPTFRLAELQLVQGAYNRQRAENNRIRPVSVPATRGQILDRSGEIFAANRVSRSVYLLRKSDRRRSGKISPLHWPDRQTSCSRNYQKNRWSWLQIGPTSAN